MSILMVIILRVVILHCLPFQSYDGEEEGFPGPQGINVGSFPKDFRYGGPDEYDSEAAGGNSADTKPRILLMGLRRSVERVRS